MAAPKAKILTSTIGLKLMMAISGVALVGFVVQHMFAHMQIFSGRDAYNGYAAFMYGLGGLLWIARGGLLAALAVHVWSGWQLRTRNQAARPAEYEFKKTQRTTPYALMMMTTGLTILAFVGYHLAHFTIGWAHPERFDVLDALGRHDVYGNYVFSFQNPLIFGLYAVAMIGVSMHLAHAATSMFRTLGIMHGRFRAPLEKVGPLVALVSGVGFMIPPLACLLGIVKL